MRGLSPVALTLFPERGRGRRGPGIVGPRSEAPGLSSSVPDGTCAAQEGRRYGVHELTLTARIPAVLIRSLPLAAPIRALRPSLRGFVPTCLRASTSVRFLTGAALTSPVAGAPGSDGPLSRRAGTSSVRGSLGVHHFLCYPQDHNVSGIIRGLPSRPTQAKVVEASHIR